MNAHARCYLTGTSVHGVGRPASGALFSGGRGADDTLLSADPRVLEGEGPTEDFGPAAGTGDAGRERGGGEGEAEVIQAPGYFGCAKCSLCPRLGTVWLSRGCGGWVWALLDNKMFCRYQNAKLRIQHRIVQEGMRNQVMYEGTKMDPAKMADRSSREKQTDNP
ncbi:cytochrome c oxidase assembly protein COX20, mitochondrial isoform X1 [Narcine bancroftii]|uniref:cytochrome c oxidase assembly protein COX20, mitochondrial isoform X1 n=1 Tax=Narcine bancroftii TaxID=1343680 RepID=UPI003831DC41